MERDYRTPQPLLCSEGELRQVFTNLIGNALDATRGLGGKIILSFKHVDGLVDRV